ncbi:flagellar basal-body rod protein FlgF [Desulfolithobacter sp.]
MVSGKYSALSGAVAREQAMATISNNLANVTTSGFKKDRVSFEAILRGRQQVGDAKGINFTRIGRIGTDFSPGAIRQTGNPLDLAIEGEGFFMVRDQNTTYLTRQGHFLVDQEGFIKTPAGHNLLDDGGGPVQISEYSGKSVIIDNDGNISVDGVVESRAQVYMVDDPEQLKKAGNSLFTFENTTPVPATGSRVVQGHLELSNVNMMEEMVLMMNTLRKYEAYHKAMKSYSTLGEKQSELGTVA